MYVTPREAANFFGVSRETVRLWAEKDKIKYTKTKGGHRKYWIEMVHASVQQTVL